MNKHFVNSTVVTVAGVDKLNELFNIHKATDFLDAQFQRIQTVYSHFLCSLFIYFIDFRVILGLMCFWIYSLITSVARYYYEVFD